MIDDYKYRKSKKYYIFIHTRSKTYILAHVKRLSTLFLDSGQWTSYDYADFSQKKIENLVILSL